MDVLTINLVLVGFGNVARRFVRLLEERGEPLAVHHGLATRIVAIATRRHGNIVREEGIEPAAALDLVGRGESLEQMAAVAPPAHGGASASPPAPRDPVDVIRRCAGLAAAAPTVMVETTTLDVRSGEPAATHVRAAFAAGMHVVTANKGPVACAYRDLRQEAARRQLQFLFEGTVMDGVPVFNLVRDTMPAVVVTGFRGVVNATTNYVLVAMEGGREFAEALGEMQRAGIAEADASLDVDGWDAAAKTAALVNVLMEGTISPADVERTGIGQLSPGLLAAARARGHRVKLVASATRTEGGLLARVAPEELPFDDPLASLAGMATAIELETDLLDRVTIIERHGGLTQTAYALLTDLVTVRRRLRVPRPGRLRRNL